MALLKFKKLLEDIETGSHLVLDMSTVTVPKATSAGYAGSAMTAGKAGTALRSGTAAFASSAGGGTGGTAGV
jgi:hypothetical protein